MSSRDGIYTRCPACHAVYELQVQELAEAAGVVRCSDCGKTFNSLASLFDQRPEENQQALQGGGMPPLLGHRVLLQHEIPGLDDLSSPGDMAPLGAPDRSATEAEKPNPIPPVRSGLWAAAAGMLLLALTAQAIWLLDWPSHLAQAESAVELPPEEAITLVARDLHEHPSLGNAVIISATLRNHTQTRITLPLLELRLYDSSNQVLGVRRFAPTEYLSDTRAEDLYLEPGQDLPIILEIMVTGSRPAGFEFRYLGNV